MLIQKVSPLQSKAGYWDLNPSIKSALSFMCSFKCSPLFTHAYTSQQLTSPLKTQVLSPCRSVSELGV